MTSISRIDFWFHSLVAAPSTGVAARPGEGRARDQEGAFSRVDLRESVVGRLLLHVAPNVMYIQSSSVGQIRQARIGRESSLDGAVRVSGVRGDRACSKV